ncbi:MAG TPA: hypothetical protein PLB35_02350 [Myxococcota bacterium]|nr:hypothetical protein [Myxococcota bacterium]HOA13072.1 hypothetical protein [Myxococcota bacterium]HOH76070.1 hypothetical protein [Myxococcota bacterium]
MTSSGSVLWWRAAVAVAFLAAGCGEALPAGNDIVIIRPDTGASADPGTDDSAEPDAAASDATVRDDAGVIDDAPEIFVTDLSGTDVSRWECDEDEDCPQSGKTCEWVACHPVDHKCYQANSYKSGDMCDEGWPCRKDGHCQGGACVYSYVDCADCGDHVCFDSGENCRDCPQDCGDCPQTDTDCGDLTDNDVDGMTDCEDTDDCGQDPRCSKKTCKDFPEASLTCGQEVELWMSSSPFLDEEELCGFKVGYFVGLYEFVPELGVQARVRITLQDTKENVRYFVLEGACNENNCIQSSDARVSKTFTANRGWHYFIVVEEIDTVFGDATIRIECQ